MRPEDWQQGIEHEAANVEDRRWARQARRVAWRRRRWAELRGVLTWRPLSRLLLVLLFPLVLPATLNLWPPSWLDALMLLLSTGWSNGGLLLVVIWAVRYVHLGYAPWALALVGAGATLLALGGLVTLLPLPEGGVLGGQLLLALIGGPLYNFALLWGLGWAIIRLRPVSREQPS